MNASAGFPVLDGKVALVSGSSRGLGRVIARRLASAGADVAIHYRQSRELAESLATELESGGTRTVVVRADVRRADQLPGLVGKVRDSLGPIDVLVHNAREYDDRPLLELTDERWREVIDASITALLVLVREVAPDMRRRGWGRIISIAANSAHVRDPSAHGVSKAALVHLSQSLAIELAPEIAVNTVSPGVIDSHELDDAARAKVIARTPRRRLVTREEVADVVAAMCGPAYEALTGQDIRLDGGDAIPRFVR